MSYINKAVLSRTTHKKILLAPLHDNFARAAIAAEAGYLFL